MPPPDRLRLHLPFAIVAALFLFQGLALWGLVQWDPIHEEWFPYAVYSWVAGVACSWNVWLMLHAGRGWRPWLESLFLAGATYWIPLGYVFWWLRSPARPAASGFFDVEGIVQLMMTAAVIEVVLLGIVLLPARWITGWRVILPASDASPSQFSLRGMLVLMAVIAGHLFFLGFLVREALEWDWRSMDDFLTQLGVMLAGRAVPTALVHLAILRLLLARRMLSVVAPAMLGLGIVGWWLVFGWLDGARTYDVVQATLVTSGSIAANAALLAGVMRMAGYRLETRRDRAAKPQIASVAAGA